MLPLVEVQARRFLTAALFCAGFALGGCAAFAPPPDEPKGTEPATVPPTVPVAVIDAAVVPALTEEGYRLGVGDRLGITVINEPDLSQEVIVNDEGAINYPFIGEVKVAGLTVQALRQAVVDGLKPDYLLDPRVTVRVVEYRNFYVNGEVQKPGGFAWQPGMTVRKAAALAGGFTDRASRSRVFAIRDGDETRTPVQITVDTPVGPGDIITIEQSFF